MQPSVETVAEQSIISSITFPIIAIIMNFLTTFVNFLTPVEKSSSRRPSLSGKNKTLTKAQKFIIVTGCDRGFGRETAIRLDKLGFSVIAGCLDIESSHAKELISLTSKRLHVLPMDVTKSDDLEYAKEWLNNNLGNKVLWGVVNNAGVCFLGTPEIMGSEELNRVIDVNFKGTVNVTKTFLPYIRKSQGRLVNMGSISGEVPMPYFSLYCATKAAIKMFTESLAYELQEWGVKVSLISPAGYKTGIIMYDRAKLGKKWWSEASDLVKDDYGREYFDMPMRVSGRIKVSSDLNPVVDCIVDALTSENPKSTYRPGAGSSMLPALMKFTPNIIKTYLCGSLLNFLAAVPSALKDRLSTE